VAQLLDGSSFRERGVDPDHVQVLAESPDRWPPILVTRLGHRVIDGHHRVAAARIIGRRKVVAELFDGSPDDAYLEFLRRNAQHGLPLTLRDRKQAATRILRQWTNWSDRRVGSVCGLSPRTVASLRAEASASVTPPPDERSLPSEQRVGRDGKLRPTNPTVRRQRIAQALAADPSASLRAIAQEVGASPETVRSVRARLRASAGETGDLNTRPGADLWQNAPPVAKWWVRDVALTSSAEGQRSVRWLSRSIIEEAEWRVHVQSIPRSRLYELAAEARRRANDWTAFAEALEGRATSHGWRDPGAPALSSADACSAVDPERLPRHP